MNHYILFGILLFLGLAIFLVYNPLRAAGKMKISEIKTSGFINSGPHEKRILRLIVAYDYGENPETISESATPEVIKSTMQSINWNEFHIVQLEDKKGNALHVSGSLAEDGLASGYVTGDDHKLKVQPPRTVEEMTEILTDFLESEKKWRNKYSYQ